MTIEYDQITSYHYSAYRPPLHHLILSKCITIDSKLDIGLDVGCGTGQSSIALTNYCEKVVGIEPSEEMIKKSIKHSQVQYLLYNGIDLNLSKNKFDIISFAGSLYYAKSQKLLDDVIRVSKHRAKIIIYDFDIKLEEILMNLIGRFKTGNDQRYNHQEDFSGFMQGNLQKEKTSKEHVQLKISNSEVVHLLLARKDFYLILSEKFGKDHPEKNIKTKLKELFPIGSIELKVNIYYTVYGVIK